MLLCKKGFLERAGGWVPVLTVLGLMQCDMASVEHMSCKSHVHIIIVMMICTSLVCFWVAAVTAECVAVVLRFCRVMVSDSGGKYQCAADLQYCRAAVWWSMCMG